VHDMIQKLFARDWFRFCAFIALLGIVMLAIQGLFFVDAGNNDISGQTPLWQEYYKQPPGSIDVALIGSSHAYNAFDTALLNDLLDLNTVKMGTGSESIIQTEIEIEELCKSHSPLAIVVEGYSFQHELSENSYLKTMNSINNGHIPLQFLFTNPNLYLENLSPLIREHYLWKNIDRLFRRFQQNAHLPSPSVEAQEARDQENDTEKNLIELEDYNRAITEKNSEASPPQDFLQAAENIITRRPCAETLAVVRAPMIHAPNTYTVYGMEAFEKLFTKYAVPYLDFNNHPLFQGHPPLLYENIHHVSHFGRVITSVETAMFLAEKLNKPLDPEKLAYYQSYYFDGYTFERDGSQVTLTLTPSDPQASAGLQYKWTVSKGDEQVQSTAYQEDPSVTFAVDDGDGGTYEVLVEINNPAGDYVVDGIFSYKPGE
jgi:hypothetical protein